MQHISIDKIVRSNKIPGVKDFTSQSPTTQAKKAEQFFLWCLLKKDFDLVGDDIGELSIGNETWKYTAG